VKVSVIVAAYKDIQALELIIESLCNQTFQGEIEIVVVEDGADKAVKAFIQSLGLANLLHTTQVDDGWRKNASLNNGIRQSSGDLLVFLDGDCVPYSDLVEQYVLLAGSKKVLCGRRVELGEGYSGDLRLKQCTSQAIEKNYWFKLLSLHRDGIRSYEEGIRLNTFFYNLKYQNKQSSILGCNFALLKEDILLVNGFDEDYVSPSVGEDTDLEWRLLKSGCQMVSARNLSNVFHLFHDHTYDRESNRKGKALLMEKKAKGQFYCANGIS
jgi:cellulose synthase/poly-beta-1,6-N-acetylglucosamine synthase-like glycosyltransferase